MLAYGRGPFTCSPFWLAPLFCYNEGLLNTTYLCIKEMEMQITLNISRKQYERARRLAEQHEQAITEILAAALDQGLTQVDDMAAAEDTAVAREKAAYLKLYPTLLTNYPGQHIAIYGGELVDHDADGIALSRRIYAHYPDEFVWITQIRNQPLRELQSHSFRWSHD